MVMALGKGHGGCSSIFCISHSRSTHAPTFLEARVHAHRADRTHSRVRMYVQGTQAWKTRANITHSQTWRHMQAGAGHARTKGTCRCWHGARQQRKYTRTQRALSTLVFGNVDLCCRLCLWNMHNAQSKPRAVGRYVDHPGILCVCVCDVFF